MNTRIIAALALAWGLGPAAVLVSAGAVAGVVIKIEGKPKVRTAGKEDFKALKINQFVYEGDRVRTGSEDRCAIAFVGGAEVRINENSNFDLESGGGQRPTLLRTTIGQAWTRLLHGKAGLSIATPAAVAAVRGTEADVESSDRLTVKVYEGLVDVYNERGSQSLAAGQMTQVSDAQSAPQAPRAMGEGDLGSWQDGLAAKGLESQLERLQKEAEKHRELELELNKDGQQKKIKIKLEKK